MKLNNIRILLLSALLFACKAPTPEHTQMPAEKPAIMPVKTAEPAVITHCFQQKFNQDVTNIKLTIAQNKVQGKMDWRPHEKDGAYGTLSGEQYGSGEMHLRYSYIIEGSRQTEEKVMKIEGNQLLEKQGELIDPKYDGNLVLKNSASATFSKIYDEISCEGLVFALHD